MNPLEFETELIENNGLNMIFSVKRQGIMVGQLSLICDPYECLHDKIKMVRCSEK